MNGPYYNHWGVAHPYWQFFLGVLLIVLVILPSWYVADMRSIVKSLQLKNHLAADGNWKELENFYERATRPDRPFVWLHRRYLLPGNMQVQHSMFLFTQGRLEEALAKNEEAIRLIEGKPWIFHSFYTRATFKTLCGALRGRTLILSDQGRYDEAREAAARLERLTGGKGEPNEALAFLEYRCGNLDKALAIGQAGPLKGARADPMLGVMAFCYIMKGDFDQALRVLAYTPTDIVKLYSPGGLQKLSSSPEGVELLESKRRKLAGVFPPARFMKLARVYIATGDFAKADEALDQAGKSLGPEPGLQMSYWRHRAFSFAGQGKAVEAETFLERMRTLLKTYPKRAFQWETRYAAGRAYLYLKRFNEALAELTEAYKVVLHPIEKHSTAFYIAKAYEGAGNQGEARRYYEIVVAERIPSRMHEQAVEALGGQERMGFEAGNAD